MYNLRVHVYIFHAYMLFTHRSTGNHIVQLHIQSIRILPAAYMICLQTPTCSAWSCNRNQCKHLTKIPPPVSRRIIVQLNGKQVFIAWKCISMNIKDWQISLKWLFAWHAYNVHVTNNQLWNKFEIILRFEWIQTELPTNESCVGNVRLRDPTLLVLTTPSRIIMFQRLVNDWQWKDASV